MQNLNHPRRWEKVLFVYNADDGFFSVLSDFAHKIVSPETYACHLCKLTYGNVMMKKDWKEYLSQLPFTKEFLHKDGFHKKYPEQRLAKLPAIFAIREGQIQPLAAADEINALQDLKALKALLNDKLLE